MPRLRVALAPRLGSLPAAPAAAGTIQLPLPPTHDLTLAVDPARSSFTPMGGGAQPLTGALDIRLSGEPTLPVSIELLGLLLHAGAAGHFDVTLVALPEPGAAAPLLAGLAWLGRGRRRSPRRRG